VSQTHGFSGAVAPAEREEYPFTRARQHYTSTTWESHVEFQVFRPRARALAEFIHHGRIRLLETRR
jgi:hypothetical protein